MIFDDARDLRITRLIDASPELVFRAWTDPALIVQWFTPKPWETIRAETDVRPGGSTLIIMRGPDGAEMPNPGVYLEVIPGRKLVITDAYTTAWEPAAKPFMTTILTFEPEDGKTRYTATARHWTAEDCQTHASMGFEAGWGMATDQMEALLAGM